MECSCQQLSSRHWNFVIITKKGSENWVWTDLPNFERFSWTKKWSWTPTLFELNYLSSLWFKSIYLSAHQIENFLNFSKLTKLYSVGQFLVPLEAFKNNRRIYFSGIVIGKEHIFPLIFSCERSRSRSSNLTHVILVSAQCSWLWDFWFNLLVMWLLW